ncbi:hypothetical protein A8709_17520 [Paenibacillus pectinilyticus]|uniref:Uncharacterized protein n=1 Tax=Paenibacillus pectinilyticus TaxID=512399 RepID=A0A1C0ZZE8_9BACL|nr:fibronectin type III domain-containing protein [Paenibacillus pectinilyticus]OCT13411.1 hypothetical protein A8709_17520 [Paenibacillus pectinilyticus]
MRKSILFSTMTCLFMMIVIGSFFVSNHDASALGTKLTLTPAMVTNETGYGDATMLVDEQTTAGDPMNGTGGSPTTYWDPGFQTGHTPAYAYIDLGQSYNLTAIYLRDYTNSGDFIVYAGSPGSWTQLFTDPLSTYPTWNAHTVSVQTRYVRFQKTSATANVSEVVIYGTQASDTTAPAAISNLAVGSPTSSSLALSWTAPGDDGNTGTATSYDIRYSTSFITSANWSSATPVSGEPSPAAAGTAQSMTVSGLSASTTYYFAMKTNDEVPNVSGLSNVSSGTTSGTATSQKLTLTTSMVTNESGYGDATMLVDEQVIAGDPLNGTGGSPTTYWDPGFQTGHTPAFAYIDLGQSYNLTSIYLRDYTNSGDFIVYTGSPGSWTQLFTDPLTSYPTWNPHTVSTQTRYVRFQKTSPTANTSEIVLYGTQASSGSDTTAPSAISNLAAASPTSSSLSLSWTAPGDDGTTGTAASYDIRYSTSTITSANWASATQISGEPAPSAAGTSQSMTVGGLSASTTYYFAIKTSDEASNISSLSNVANATTSSSGSSTLPVITNLHDSRTVANRFYVTLSWTAPAYDGTISTSATATPFDLRYSTSPITEANWNNATQAPFEPLLVQTSDFGTTKSMAVSGLSAGTSYYFAMKTIDNAGHSSAISNVVNASTTSTFSCTYSIPQGVATMYYGTSGTNDNSNIYLNAQPGDVVCLTAGNYGLIKLSNFTGTNDNPIIFINSGGLANFQSTGSYGFKILGSSFFRLTGSGSASYAKGIKIGALTTGAPALTIAGYSTNYEVDHLEIDNANSSGSQGIALKTDPDSCGFVDRNYFTQMNTSVHDNYIHNTGVEGIYIGGSHYSTSFPIGMACDGNSSDGLETLYEHSLHGVRVYNNVTDSTGWDGIQVGSATYDVEIHHNTVTNYATLNATDQRSGIQINPGTTGKLYNNWIDEGTAGHGQGINNQSRGNQVIFNNVILHTDYQGIYSKDMYDATNPAYDHSPIYIVNNTFINPGSYALQFDNVQNYGSLFGNNIVIKSSSNPNPYVNPGSTITEVTNLESTNIADAHFVNAGANNYHLSVDLSGTDMSIYGVTTDYDGVARPNGSTYDIGAYEH